MRTPGLLNPSGKYSIGSKIREEKKQSRHGDKSRYGNSKTPPPPKIFHLHSILMSLRGQSPRQSLRCF